MHLSGANAADLRQRRILDRLRDGNIAIRGDLVFFTGNLRALIEKLDVPAKIGGNTRVVYLRNAEATKLASTRGLRRRWRRATFPMWWWSKTANWWKTCATAGWPPCRATQRNRRC